MRSFLVAIIALVFVWLTSCAPNRLPPASVPTPPPRAVPVAPEASKVRESIAVADRTAVVIDTTAKDAARAATEARKEAERLKTQKSAAPAELDRLWQDLQSLEARNLFMETQASRLVANLTDARNTAAILQQVAAEKDAEADGLRSQNTQLGKTVSNYSTELNKSYADAAKQRSRADLLAGEIRLYRLALGIASLLIVLYLFARFLLPRFIP